ncbi:MAG TPA: tetratricopeptide repeat protein [Gemmatimonadales bacterium]|nr:tetratricopeptide repeat protein [Gemmatimonadales bacterium]
MSLTPQPLHSAAIGSPPPLRIEQALRLLPDVDDLAPLRGFAVSLASNRSPARAAWTASEPNRTVGKRTLDPAVLRAKVPQVLSHVAARVAVLYGAAVDALESEQAGDLSQAVRALVRAGEYEEDAARYAQAHAWYRQALGIAEQLRDRQPEMEALCHLGRLEAARGYLDEGARAFQRSLALAEAESDHEHAAGACHGLGNVLFAQSQWSGAEAWFTRGLQHAQSNRSLSGALALGLGQTAQRRGDNTTAAELLARARESFDAIGDRAGVIRTLLARGQAEAAQGRTAEALATYREALGRVPVVEPDSVLELSVRLRLAELYLELGRLPDAEDELRRGEDLAITYQQTRWLARVYVLMGRLRGQQQDDNGFVFFEQAIELCRSGEPARRLEADVYREYARFRWTMGDRHEARAYLERARELLEPFGDDVARERIEQDLRQLDVWVVTDGAPTQ